MKLHRLVMAGAIASLGLVAPAFAEEDEVIVTPPYTVHRENTGRSAIGARTETVSVSRAVTITDLDLRTEADADELYRRVNYTAEEVCDIAENLMSSSATSDRECVRGAVRSARPQVRDAIERARYY